MNIVVISDTHGKFDILYDIVTRNQGADLFIHLGDGEREYYDVRNLFPEKAFLFLKGNNDWGDYPLVHIVNLDGHKFFMTHGHNYGRLDTEDYIASSASANGCDVALFGHTHLPLSMEMYGVHLFNPGSPSRPRGMNKPSYGLIEIKKDGSLKFTHKDYVF